MIKYDDLTPEERVELMLKDTDAYMALLTDEHYFQLLDGIAKLGPYKEVKKDG